MNQLDVKSLAFAIAIGVILLILEYRSGFFQRQPGQAVTFKQLLGSLAAISLVFLTYFALSTYIFTEQASAITIDSPIDGTVGPARVTVEGKYSNVPRDKELLLYVYGTKARKYYINPVDVLTNGRWQALDIPLGEPNEKTGTFIVGVIVVDHVTSAQLQQGPVGVSALPISPAIHITVYRNDSGASATSAATIVAASEPTITTDPTSSPPATTEPTSVSAGELKVAEL